MQASSLPIPSSSPNTLDTLSDDITLPKGPTAKTWARRLNTKEDKGSLHKISGITFVLSSTLILGVGALTGFKEVPEWLQVADAAVLVSTAFQFFTSIDMAIHHRRRQPHVRDQFLVMAATSMYLAVSATIYTPFTPSILCDKSIFDSIVVPLLLYTIYVTLGTVKNPETLLLAREKKKVSSPDQKQISNYILSTIVPCLASVGFLYYLADPTHDRDWILNFANERGGASYFYYTLVLNNTFTMYSALLLTLLDKKLVPKHLEYSLATFLFVVPSIPNFMLMF